MKKVIIKETGETREVIHTFEGMDGRKVYILKAINGELTAEYSIDCSNVFDVSDELRNPEITRIIRELRDLTKRAEDLLLNR